MPNKKPRSAISGTALVGVGFITFLVTVYLIPYLILGIFQLEKLLPNQRTFARSCRALNNQELSIHHIRSLKGTCFEATPDAGSRAVECQPDHLDPNYALRNPHITNLVTVSSNYLDTGWRCKIFAEGNTMRTELEWYTD